ncbi:hypothetical protein MW887_005335 [Aspergillus wentii]|nr:hypothetical protein MW887_005335 [Aspergillus wentii]
MAYHSQSPFSGHIPAYNPVAAMTAPAGTFLPGTKVQVGSHRVVVEKYLSEGGFAHVYVVRLPQPVDGVNTAVLKRVAVPDKSALANMRTEVETMKKLKGHRHIVKYIDSHASQLQGGGYEVFLLMEFCSGGGLIDFMNTRLQNRLTEPEIIKIFSDVSEGVACMHYLKPPLLHRDLKVENVLISRQGSTSYYKLCDFGSTAPPRPAATSGAEGRLIEDDVQRHTTLQYRSPEMIDVYRKQPIDEKSDIWALGVLLYKLCYYTTPFEEVGQMAILNASYKFPSYPPFSARLKMFIASMLKENPQKRPNIYEVIREVCLMQGKEVPIRDIYSGRSTSEARRYQELPPSPTEAPQIGAVFSPPVQETQIIPEIAPMRRGRPARPDTSQHNSAKPSPSPYRGSTDPFAALDGKSRGSTEEFANRFPSLDQFQILHEKGGKFDFEPTVAENPEDENLSQRLTNALADDAFAKRPSSEDEPVRESSINRRSQIPSSSDVKLAQPRNTREESRQQTPLYQPVPQKPVMVSTGTMTSPPATPGLPDLNLPARPPIHRFPATEHPRHTSNNPWADETEKRPPVPSKDPSPTVPSFKAEPNPRTSADRISNVSASARPSLETVRPSNLDITDPMTGRSKSANAKARPVSVGAKYDIPRESGSTRSSLELPRPPYDAGAPLQHARTAVDREYERGNISSDVDYLRAREEEEQSRKKEKRASGSSKHTKRSSLSNLSFSGTKTIFAGRFGDAFRRFESSNQDGKSKTPSPEDTPKLPTTIMTEEVAEPGIIEGFEEDEEDISPEMRRELERRRLSQEERRVAEAAAEYRRRAAERGEGGWRPGGDGTRSAVIQNRVQSLMGDTNKPLPQKTATGYGRFTDEASETSPALQAKQTDARVVYGTPTGRTSPVKEGWGAREAPQQTTGSTGYVAAQDSGPRPSLPTRPAVAPKPALPPKPKNLQSGVTGSQGNSPTVQETPTGVNEDWESNFSRRYPSLSGLEMVETEIEIPKVASMRTKEV